MTEGKMDYRASKSRPGPHLSSRSGSATVSRFTLCLVRIELNLRRFRKPTFIGLKSGASCKYLTSISQTSKYLSAWVGCHNNFVKAKDAFSRVRGRFWNMMLMMFYLNVFSLSTLKDIVGHYMLWTEVIFG